MVLSSCEEPFGLEEESESKETLLILHGDPGVDLTSTSEKADSLESIEERGRFLEVGAQDGEEDLEGGGDRGCSPQVEDEMGFVNKFV